MESIELTKTELKVVQFVVQNISIAEISEQLNSSPVTIQGHVRNIYRAAGLNNYVRDYKRAELIARYSAKEIDFVEKRST